MGQHYVGCVLVGHFTPVAPWFSTALEMDAVCTGGAAVTVGSEAGSGT